MTEGKTCYARDEALCTLPPCQKTGCILQGDGPNEKLVAMWEKYAALRKASELPLSDKTVSELIKLAEDCYAEITRRAMVAINGPSRSA
jgi:hypothetical protein